MNRPAAIADEVLHDLIDERLPVGERARLAAGLAGSPELLARLEAMRRQHEALKRIGEEVLHEPVPERLRRVLRRGGLLGHGGYRLERVFGFGRGAAAILTSTGGLS